MYNVLHVERSAAFRKVLHGSFSDQDIGYCSTGSISEALGILDQCGIDLIITAVELDDGTGEEFIKKIGEGPHGKIPVIVISANDSIELRKKMYSLGVVDFIPKSLAIEKLLNYINKFILEEELNAKLGETRIAVLDDSRSELAAFKMIFDDYGITSVDYFGNGNSLLAEEKEYSIYLIDIILPDYSGEQIIYEIKKRYPKSVIIACSSIEHENAISGVLMTGANDFIQKPFNSVVFMARIKAGLRSYLLYREIERKNAELQEMVITDGLTKLYNHRHLYERLEEEISKAKRFKKNLSIIMLDIDHFKLINDSHGHQAGDRVLVAVADTIHNCLRRYDIAGRYGGEEFVIILPEADIEQGYALAERIRLAIQSLGSQRDGLSVTVSAGVAELAEENALGLIERADASMYRAKQNGRNRTEKQAAADHMGPGPAP